MKFACASSLFLLASTAWSFQTPLTAKRGVSHTFISSTIGGMDSEPDKPAVPLTPPSTVEPEFEMATTSFQDIKMPTSLKEFKMPESMASLKDNLPDLSSIMENLQDGGELGSRGEIFVAGQLILMLAVLLGGGIPFLDGALGLMGPLFLVAGLAACAVSVSDLSKRNSLSPFVTPNAKSELMTSGMYQYVRHPLYAALIMTCTGLSLVTDSASRLLLTALLFALLNVKTEKEEEEMINKFPAYTEYKEKVTGKFFPIELVEETKSKFLN